MGILRDKWFIFSLKDPKSSSLRLDFGIGNSVMAFVVGYFSIFQEEYLRGFVWNAKTLGYQVGKGTVGD